MSLWQVNLGGVEGRPILKVGTWPLTTTLLLGAMDQITLVGVPSPTQLDLLVVVTNLGKMTAAGGLIKTNARKHLVNATLITDVHIVVSGTMGS